MRGEVRPAPVYSEKLEPHVPIDELLRTSLEGYARERTYEGLKEKVKEAKSKVEEFLVEELDQAGIKCADTVMMASYVYCILDFRQGHEFFRPEQIENQLTRLTYHVKSEEPLLRIALNEYAERKIH